MQFVGKVISSVSEFYRDINPSTLSGAIDVVVVENVETGELACSPFHVRFGKLQLLRPQEKAVELKINGVAVGEELRMKVGEAGETFFVLSREELGMGGGATDLPLEYLTSPLVGPETPAPLESIEEFKLAGNREVTNTNNPSNPGNPSTVSLSNTSTTRLTTVSNTSLSVTSPEWKWEWGDLPIKKEKEEVDATEDKLKKVPIVTTTTATVELYEFLAGKDYLFKIHEVLARFPARSMITRIYRIDRGLHFQSAALWPDQLTSSVFLNESNRVLESDFLLNPNVVIEESSRLLYQFTWENKKVVLAGSVGAAVVFYAQAYSRILPLEILSKLAEVAAIRMAKRKFSKSAERMVESEDANEGLAVENENIESERVVPTTITSPSSSLTVDNLDNGILSISAPVAIAPSESKSKSSWRSWWSRSNANSTSASSASLSMNEKERDREKAENSSGVVGSTPLTTVTTTSSPSVIGSPSKKILDIAPATLSSLIADSDLSGSNSSIEDKMSSPSKRIIQRTSSSVSMSVNTATGTASVSSPPVSKKENQQYIKSLRLPSHLLRRLNLKPGVNTISYTVNTRLQGTATCQSRIFFWRSDARVVISDIDGTITKSDALGHLFTMVGKDWTHVGVAQLYSKIAANGYEFLYLTSRAIGQAASTRGYLKGVEQDRLQLPDGPVIMSPDRLFTALHREVIQRRPDEFKIACLRDIQKLFVKDEEEVSMMGSGVVSSSEDEYSVSVNGGAGGGSVKLKISSYKDTENHTKNISNVDNKSNIKSIDALMSVNPFYAGFGNRPTDTKSYKAVGISASRIFLINPAGDLKLDKLTFYTPYSASSYSKLTEEVDKVFPPVRSPSSLTRTAGDEAFTDFQYWHGQGGDVRMDLVQMALSAVKKVEAVVDEQGKPISPVTLQKQLGTPFYCSDMSDSTRSLLYPGSPSSPGNSSVTNGSVGVTSPTPPLPPRKSVIENDGENDADEEESDSYSEDEEEGDDIMEAIDSFPFI